MNIMGVNLFMWYLYPPLSCHYLPYIDRMQCHYNLPVFFTFKVDGVKTHPMHSSICLLLQIQQSSDHGYMFWCNHFTLLLRFLVSSPSSSWKGTTGDALWILLLALLFFAFPAWKVIAAINVLFFNAKITWYIVAAFGVRFHRNGGLHTKFRTTLVLRLCCNLDPLS